MAYNLSGILTGGAAGRSDSISGLDTDFMSNLQRMMEAAPPEIANELRIMSAFRSPETQQRLWNDAIKKYGSESAARKWVAPPSRSQHGFGQAIDWSYGSKNAREWVRANAGKFGMVFPLANEPWHMEAAGARSKSMSMPTTTTGVTLTSGPGAGLSSPMVTSPSAPESSAPSGGGAFGALEGLIKGFTGGGGGQQQASADTDIAPSSISNEVGGGAGAYQAAAQLMASLLQKKQPGFGLSLGGMM